MGNLLIRMELLVKNTEQNVLLHKEEHSPALTALITGICHLNFLWIRENDLGRSTEMVV